MIVYNIRANGPYEYDKFMLNYGQLHNLVSDMETRYQNSDIVTGNLYVRNNITLAEELDQVTAEDGILNRIALLRTILTE